jgi:Uma2 family endonuclease
MWRTVMSMAQPRPRYSVDDYLSMEREATERHIYLDGEIYAMAGESLAHVTISVNLVVSLGNQLKDTPCRALMTDTKVRSSRIPLSGKSTNTLFTYPDIFVVSGEPEFHDAFRDVILNPATIVEVLSPSTEAHDRGKKFHHYQKWNPTLRDYILVSQDKPQIEHFCRQPNGRWSYDCYEGLECEVVIASIQCILKLVDVYDRLVFAEE